jgi:two-component SAPR family response regulator
MENKNYSIDTYGVLLFDCRDIDFMNKKLTDLCSNNRLVISIGKNPMENVVNIYVPFRIGSLFQKISNFISYSKNNIATKAFGTINFNENTLVKNNVVIQFTEKEMELIKKIMATRISRGKLLKSVWGTTAGDNRVLETSLYNIRQKLADGGIDDFIECSDGYYQIKVLE